MQTSSGLGDYVAVNMAFGDNKLLIVGAGGVWHVSGVRERLARDFQIFYLYRSGMNVYIPMYVEDLGGRLGYVQ